MAQLGMCLSYKHKNPSLTPRTHENESKIWWYELVSLEPRRQRQVDPWGLLTSQATLIVKL